MLCTFSIMALAQLPDDFRSEQIFMFPVRTSWAVGDTVQVEGMVTCLSNTEYLPYSKYLYLEFINGNDSVMMRQKVSCSETGYFKAAVPTNSADVSGIYYLRAYTNLMRNFSMESFAVQPLLLGRPFPKRTAIAGDNVHCIVCPDGGKLVAGGSQSVTAMLSDGMGDPLCGKSLGLIADNGDTLAECQTSSSGFALFNFIPQAGTQYRVALSENGVNKTFDLPSVDVGAMKIQGGIQGNRLYYKILNVQGGNLSNCRLYAYTRENGISVLGLTGAEGFVNLPSSTTLVTLFLTDTANQILSECTVVGKYVAKQEPQKKDTISLGDSIVVPPLPDNGMVFARLVTDDEMWMPHAESALYEADYSSPLPFPMGMFGCGAPERSRDLTAWLKTVTFKRFLLKEAVEKKSLLYTHMPEKVLSFSGQVLNEAKRPFKKGTLLAYNTETDFVYDAPIDSLGHFVIGVDDYGDGESFFLQAITAKGKPVFSTINVDDATFPPVVLSKHYTLEKTENVEHTSVSLEKMAGIHDLPEVVVKARMRHDPQMLTNKFYERNYIGRRAIEEHNYLSLLDILNAMPEIILWYSLDANLQSVVGNWSIVSRRGQSTMSGSQVVLLIDGIREENVNNVMEMSASDIEEVEYLRPWQALAYTHGAIDGAVMVKTRKISHPSQVASKGTFYTPIGLSRLAKDSPSNSLRPSSPGNYRLLIDIFSDGKIESYEHPVVVREVSQ